jgi:hypothetical protein
MDKIYSELNKNIDSYNINNYEFDDSTWRATFKDNGIEVEFSLYSEVSPKGVKISFVFIINWMWTNEKQSLWYEWFYNVSDDNSLLTKYQLILDYIKDNY